MSEQLNKLCTAFQGSRRLASGPLAEVVLAVKTASESNSNDALLVFDDANGRVIDLDLRGTSADVIDRLAQAHPISSGRFRARDGAASTAGSKTESAEPRGRGRPKLGVVSREITLLPAQWEWLAAQPEGASSIIRKLVDEARRNTGAQQKKAAQEATYQFMLAIAGDRPGYEEATRALFAHDYAKLEQLIKKWPQDIKAYILQLSAPAAAVASNTK